MPPATCASADTHFFVCQEGADDRQFEKDRGAARPFEVKLDRPGGDRHRCFRGIGKSIALVLAGAGAKVACVARSVDKLTETAEAIRAAGGTAEVFECDVASSSSVEKVVEAVTGKWERLDILVNNAGITRDTLIPRMSDADWDDVINTNLRGTFLFTRAATLKMMQTPLRPDHQYLERVGADGQPGAVELFGLEGGHDRPDADRGQGAGRPQGDGQRHRPRLHRKRNDGRPGAGDIGRSEKADSGQADGPARGNRLCRACFWPARRPATSPARC